MYAHSERSVCVYVEQDALKQLGVTADVSVDAALEVIIQHRCAEAAASAELSSRYAAFRTVHAHTPPDF